MRLSLPRADLATYVANQITHFFPDRGLGSGELEPFLSNCLERVEHCFSRVKVKYFERAGEACFDHLHTDQYAAFLYLLSNTVHHDAGDPKIAAKLYALNKALHGVDIYFEVDLPSVFALQHPVGTVLGRAKYGNFFYVYQRCSVGSGVDGESPVIGNGVVMYGGSSIIGRCTVGSNCLLSTGTLAMDASIPDGSVVFGSSPHLVIKPGTRRMADQLFRTSEP